MNGHHAVPSRRILWLIAGFVLWSAAFLAIYMILTVGCAYGWHRQELVAGVTLQRLVLVTSFLMTLALGALLLRRVRAAHPAADAPPPANFLDRASRWATLAAFVAIVATFAPTLVLTTCY